MVGETLFASDGLFALLTFLPLIINVVLTGLGIYVAIKVVHFMSAKTKADRERNERLEELIRAVKQREME